MSSIALTIPDDLGATMMSMYEVSAQELRFERFNCIMLDVCKRWPHVRGILTTWGNRRVYNGLEQHPIERLLTGHGRYVVNGYAGKGQYDMTWELCTILMLQRNIKSVTAALELLHCMVWLWKECGICGD